MLQVMPRHRHPEPPALVLGRQRRWGHSLAALPPRGPTMLPGCSTPQPGPPGRKLRGQLLGC